VTGERDLKICLPSGRKKKVIVYVRGLDMFLERKKINGRKTRIRLARKRNKIRRAKQKRSTKGSDVEFFTRIKGEDMKENLSFGGYVHNGEAGRGAAKARSGEARRFERHKCARGLRLRTGPWSWESDVSDDGTGEKEQRSERAGT